MDKSKQIGMSGPGPSVYSFANINIGYLTTPPKDDHNFLLDFQYKSNLWTMTLTPALALSTNGNVRVCGNMVSETLSALGVTSIGGTTSLGGILNVTALSTLSGGLSTSGTTTLDGGFSCSTSRCSIGNTINPRLFINNSSLSSGTGIIKFNMATSTNGSLVGISATKELLIENRDMSGVSISINYTRRLYK